MKTITAVSYNELLAIQNEQLRNWQKLLKPKVFKKLKAVIAGNTVSPKKLNINPAIQFHLNDMHRLSRAIPRGWSIDAILIKWRNDAKAFKD